MMLQQLEPRRLLSLTPLGNEQLVPESNQTRDWEVAVADNGMYMIVAAVLPNGITNSGPLGGGFRITRYSADGQQLGQTIRIDLVADRLLPTVAAAMDPDGDAVIAYPDLVAPDDWTIKMVRISKDGVMSPAMEAFIPLDDEVADISDAAVSMDDSGGFFVAWHFWPENIGADGSIRARAFNADGTPRGEAFPVFDESISTLYDLGDIAASPDGSGAVVTVRQGGEAPDAALFRRISTSAVLGEIQGIGSTSTESAVAVFPDNSFIFAYQRESGGPIGGPWEDFTVFAQRYNAAGERVGNEIEIGASLPGEGLEAHTYGVDAAALDDGSFVASFIQQIGDANTVYVQSFTPSGADGGEPLAIGASHPRVIASTSDEYTPRVGVDASGNVVVTRHETRDGPLHYRRLSSGVMSLDQGSLSILGTADNDSITIALDDSDIVVTYNATTRTFPASNVQHISVNALGGNDTITNDTSLPSTLSGGEGDDTVFGGDANDRIRGETGRDSLWGRDGKDTIFGDDGVDSLYGNGGGDRINGGANSDHIRGNSGRDKLFGGHGNDRIYGSESADWLWGGIGDDHLYGEGSNDILYGESGMDTLDGLAGDDLLVSNNDGSIDNLTGGRGRDTAVADQDDILAGIDVTASAGV